ncbi:MAG TPA: DUF2891 domain-containing protein [Brevundimonas sp.]|uniref:DUF2891 domain-containing protein n=1 Tax=Brevundimonas sp. TaxID=1871086 RepID=UPI002B76E260|nr:DUF2891 domain-containing protein [Brevundimonas sp.]HRH21232.1 DUF2891 domain-containing protein [Brevundimonas sp.]
MTLLDLSTASRFAAAALGHVGREYPNKMDHVLDGPEDARGPRAFHPVFFGSFDWHSCVHGWWTLATLTRLYPQMPEADLVLEAAATTFTADRVEAERAYLDRPSSRGFERPYGWAWLLMLQAELNRHDTEAGRRWAMSLEPLSQAFAERFKAFLPISAYPVRVGTHYSTAFALRLALDYARQVGDGELDRLLQDKALAWYGSDRDCQAWEPDQDAFLSPALMEAELMRGVLGDDFAGWFDDFLPRAGDGQPAVLFEPVTPSDRSDGKIAHLDGLNLSRAWCWRGIASALPPGHAARSRALEAADQHLAASLPHVTGDYMGEHWLASFALLAQLASDAG